MTMLPSTRDRWLEELLNYLDERQGVVGDCVDNMRGNNYMRWHSALKFAMHDLECLGAENARLSKAVCSDILGALLTPDENEALVGFVKSLRGAP